MTQRMLLKDQAIHKSGTIHVENQSNLIPHPTKYYDDFFIRSFGLGWILKRPMVSGRVSGKVGQAWSA